MLVVPCQWEPGLCAVRAMTRLPPPAGFVSRQNFNGAGIPTTLWVDGGVIVLQQILLFSEQFSTNPLAEAGLLH